MPNHDAPEPLYAAITIMGSGRLGPTVSAVIGLIAVAVGARTFIRRRTDDGRGAVAALALGGCSLAAGVLFLATADGGPGTGNGVVASIGAVVLGPIAIALGLRVVGWAPSPGSSGFDRGGDDTR
jgi:hypothetical protein